MTAALKHDLTGALNELLKRYHEESKTANFNRRLELDQDIRQAQDNLKDLKAL